MKCQVWYKNRLIEEITQVCRELTYETFFLEEEYYAAFEANESRTIKSQTMSQKNYFKR